MQKKCNYSKFSIKYSFYSKFMIKLRKPIKRSDNMDKENYNKHFLLNTETAKTYAVEYLKYFNNISDIDCIEIGDGNINYVLNSLTKRQINHLS